MSINRALGDTPFTLRQRNQIALLHEELGRLFGSRLRLEPGGILTGIPPRQRLVLDGLMPGDTEKQIAARLGLSRHTVHDHVIALYRRFKLHHRAELIAFGFRCGWKPKDGGYPTSGRNADDR